MITRQLAKTFAPAGLALLAGGGAHLLWAAPLATVLAAAIAAFAGTLAVNRPEDAAPAEAARARKPDSVRPSDDAGLRLLEILPLGIVLIARGGEVVFTNVQAAEIFGRRPAGAFHAAALRSPKLLDAVEQSLSDDVASTVEFTLARGKDRHFRALIRPLAGAAPPKAAAVLMVIEDITQAQRAEELHRDFVANASHELKTPLAAIGGAIETLQGHAKGDQEATERFLGMMAQQSDRMRRLVEDLLSLNRIEVNERIMPRDVLSLCDVVAEAVDAAAPLAAEAGITLDLATPEADPQVLGSQEELRQAFENLIENGIRYGNRAGSVAVRYVADAARQPGKVGVAVIDDGPGIAREHLPRLTERFYRVSVSRSRARGGTGLGLAIVKHVLNRHRGHLSVESTLGTGSTFTVWLPLLEREDGAA